MDGTGGRWSRRRRSPVSCATLPEVRCAGGSCHTKSQGECLLQRSLPLCRLGMCNSYLTEDNEQPMKSGIEYAVLMRVETAIFRSIQMSQRTVAAGQSNTTAFSSFAILFSLCLGLTLILKPLPGFANDSWGCLSQSLFWARVQETVTDSMKSHEITLSGRSHDSGYSDINEYHQSLHIFEDGAWVTFNIAIRESASNNEILYCLISRGSSSTLHRF